MKCIVIYGITPEGDHCIPDTEAPLLGFVSYLYAPRMVKELGRYGALQAAIEDALELGTENDWELALGTRDIWENGIDGDEFDCD